MANLNQIQCVNNLKNVGFGTCTFDPALIAGAILFGQQTIFTPEMLQDLQETLTSLTTTDSKAQRAYPINQFVGVTDGTEPVKVQTFPYGKKAIVRDGDYDLSFQFVDGALCLLTALQTFNGNTPFLLYDKNNVIIGTTVNGMLSTIPPQFFYANPWKVATGDAVAVYMIQFVFNAQYINKQLGFVQADFDISSLSGLQDVQIAENSFNPATGLVNVSIQTLCNKVNMFDAFLTPLSNKNNYTAYNAETGEAIAISTVAPVTGGKTFNITLDAADANYPGAGGSIALATVAPSVLKEADMVGYESIALILEIPGS